MFSEGIFFIFEKLQKNHAQIMFWCHYLTNLNQISLKCITNGFKIDAPKENLIPNARFLSDNVCE